LEVTITICVGCFNIPKKVLSLLKKFKEEKYVLGMYVLHRREVFEVTIFVEIMHNDAQVVLHWHFA
jgi:hypothetical protein